MTTSIESRVVNASEKFWSAVDGIVLEKEVNGCKQRISIDTINGAKVRCLSGSDKRVDEIKGKVDVIFPNGLPDGVNAVFISVTDN